MDVEIDEETFLKHIESNWLPSFESDTDFKEIIDSLKGRDVEKEKYYKQILLCLSFQLDPCDRYFFKPQYKITLNDGTIKNIPDPKEVNKEVLETVRSFVGRQKNSHINSRFFDILWCFGDKANKQLTDRTQAIEYYKRSAKLLADSDIPYSSSISLSRLLALSNQTGEAEHIESGRTFFLSIIELFKKNKDYNNIKKTLEYLIVTFNTNKEFYSGDKIRALCEDCIQNIKKEDSTNHYIERKFLNLIKDSYKCENDEKHLKETFARIAQSFVTEGDELEETQGGMARSHSYSEAIKIYNNIGGYNAEVERLKVCLLEGNKQTIQEMEHHEINQVIPKSAIDAVNKGIDHLISLEPEASLFLLTQFDILPTEDKLREEATNIMKEFPLSHIFDSRVFNSYLEVKTLKENHEKVSHNIGKQFHIHIQLGYAFKIKPYFDKFQEKHTNFTDIILGIYQKSEFKNDARCLILKSGLMSYQEKRFIDASHVLCPFIEGMIRDMLALIKAPIVSIRGNHQKARDMGDMLTTLRVALADDPQVPYFLEMFYCEFYGFNFRNSLSHGLIDGQILESRFFSDMNIFTIVLLLSYAPKKHHKGS